MPAADARSARPSLPRSSLGPASLDSVRRTREVYLFESVPLARPTCAEIGRFPPGVGNPSPRSYSRGPPDFGTPRRTERLRFRARVPSGAPSSGATLGESVWPGAPEYPPSGRYESVVLGFGLVLIALGVLLSVPGFFPGVPRVTGFELLGIGGAVTAAGAVQILRDLRKR